MKQEPIIESHQSGIKEDTLILIMSQALGEKDGLSFFNEIYRAGLAKNLSCILMAPIKFKHDAKYLHSQGFSDYFYKPLSKTKLVRSLNNALSHNQKHEKTEVTAKQELSLPSKARILVVEDTPINQLVVQGILESFNLTCDVAANGLEALAMMKNVDQLQPYDVVLMDCQMPVMDGYDATVAIRLGRAGENSTQIPIIAMTANAMKGDEEKCLASGMNDYISKPVDPMIIRDKLAKWLNG